MPMKTIHSREINSIIESQMRQWVISCDQQEKSDSSSSPDAQPAIKYISISRDIGSGGAEIGQTLSKLTEWQIYDKEILDYMAEDMNVRKNVLKSVDERTIGFIEEWLIPFFAKHQVAQNEYFHHLSKTLMIIANYGKAIIIGRGAGMILPPNDGLRIRITSPIETRIQNIAKRDNISLDEAKLLVQSSDKSRCDFVQKIIGKDIFDCLNYDLVINTKHLSTQAAAKLIWRALDQRIEK